MDGGWGGVPHPRRPTVINDEATSVLSGQHAGGGNRGELGEGWGWLTLLAPPPQTVRLVSTPEA